MAINFVQGQVAVSDPNASYPNPTATSNIKDVVVKVVKLTSANYTVTTSTKALVAVLPADATILDMKLWVKTQLAGGGVTGATLALGTTSGGAELMAANAAAFGTAGVNSTLSPLTGIMQNYNVPFAGDIQVWATGLTTIGTPTSGEQYLSIYYVR
jgi:hypothetical protein